jgi:outer membrane protein OmpA-like peptidoglycan-associated protein
MNKYNDNRFDSNLMITAGLNIAFGSTTQKAAPVKEEVVKEEVVDNSAQEEADRKAAEEKARLEALAKAKSDAAAAALLAIANADDDNDGVRNADDKCPNTIAGDAVDKNGCAKEINLHINFENASSSVDEASKVNIVKAADFLKENIAYKANIIGYTDSIGSKNGNKKLSQERANTVRDMIISEGVDAARLTAVGKGEENPIADNSTKEGRAQNRRIEAELFH